MSVAYITGSTQNIKRATVSSAGSSTDNNVISTSNKIVDLPFDSSTDSNATYVESGLPENTLGQYIILGHTDQIAGAANSAASTTGQYRDVIPGFAKSQETYAANDKAVSSSTGRRGRITVNSGTSKATVTD